MSAPETTLYWEINGDSMTAWASDLEMFEISPHVDAPIGRPHKLTINHIGHCQAVHLGWFSRLSAAQKAALRFESVARTRSEAS